MEKQVGFQTLKPSGLYQNTRTGQLDIAPKLDHLLEEFLPLEIIGQLIQIEFQAIGGNITLEIDGPYQMQGIS